MTGGLIGEEIIVFHRASSNIVDDEGNPVVILLVGNDHNVRAVVGQDTGDQVPRFVVPDIFGDFEGNPTSFEIGA